jgi:hypothetical protein
VFEPVADNDRVFVMQGYAQIVDADLLMATAGKAEIILDDLDNAYELMTD